MKQVRWQSLLIFVSITILAIWYGSSLLFTQRQIRRSQQIADQYQAKIERLAEQVVDSQQQLQLATSSAEIEKALRERLLYQLPGEVIIQLPKLDALNPTPIQLETPVTPRQEWRQLLFPH